MRELAPGPIAAAALLCCLVPWSRAQGQEARTLSQDQALARAEQRAPEVLVSLAQAEVAQSEVGVSHMFPNPQIGGGASPSYRFIATLFIRLPVFGQLGKAEQAALARARVAEAGVDVVRLDARLSASLAWIDLWTALREAALAESDATRYDRMLAAAQARVADGDAPELDRIRAEADARLAHAQLDALRTYEMAASARLAVLLGDALEAETLLAPSGEPHVGEPPSIPELDARLNAHPLARHAREGVNAAGAAATRDGRSRWPELGLAVQDWNSREKNTHDVRVIGTMDLPIFDRARVTRADTLRSTAETDADAVRARLRGTAVATRAEHMAAQQRCQALEESVLPAAREVAERSEEAYKEGDLDLAAMQIAWKSRSDVERSLLACQAERARAWARLEHALGGPDAE